MWVTTVEFAAACRAFVTRSACSHVRHAPAFGLDGGVHRFRACEGN